jgi:hypothetical protein
VLIGGTSKTQEVVVSFPYAVPAQCWLDSLVAANSSQFQSAFAALLPPVSLRKGKVAIIDLIPMLEQLVVEAVDRGHGGVPLSFNPEEEI